MKKLFALFLTLIMTFSLVACGQKEPLPSDESGSDSSNQKPIEIKVCTIDPASKTTSIILQEMIDEIREKTDGIIDMQLYTDGQMMVREEGVEAVISDANVIVVSQPSYLSSYVPVMGAFSAPYIFPNYETTMAFYNGEYFDGIKKDCADAGIHIICADALTGFRDIIATTPVKCVDDVRKLSIRIAGLDGLMMLWDNMKANYTVIPFGDVFNALQTGAIQGYENTSDSIVLSKMYEAADLYYCKTAHLLDGYYLICGEGFWQSIPAEYQSIINEILGNWGKRVTEELKSFQDECFAQFDELGVPIIESEEIDLDDFRSYADPIINAIDGGAEVKAEIDRIASELQ